MALNDTCADQVCLFTLETLDNMVAVKPETQDMNNYGTLMAVRESAARGGNVSELITIPGKEPSASGSDVGYYVKYYQQTTATLTNAPTDGCADASAISLDPKYDKVETISTGGTYSFKISENLFRNNCESFRRELANQFTAAARAMKVRLNDYYADAILAACGDYPSENGVGLVDSLTNPRTIYLFSDADGDQKPRAMAFVDYSIDVDRMGLFGNSAFIGGRELQRWIRSQRIFTGDTEGRDASRYSGLQDVGSDLYVDYKLDVNTSGSNRALAFGNGYARPVFHQNYTDGFAVVNNLITRTSIDADPMLSLDGLGPGLPIDLHVRIDDCALPYPEIHYTLVMNYGLWTISPDAFSTTAGQYHNGFLNYTLGCGDTLCAT